MIETCDYCSSESTLVFLLGHTYTEDYTRKYCKKCYKFIANSVFYKLEVVTREEFLIAQIMES